MTASLYRRRCGHPGEKGFKGVALRPAYGRPPCNARPRPLHHASGRQLNRRLRRLHPEVLATVFAGIARFGGTAIADAVTDLLTVNGEFTLSLVVVRCRHTTAGSLRCHIYLDTGLLPALTLAVRMDARSVHALAYS